MKSSDSKIVITLINENNINIKTQFRTFDILNTVKKKIYSLFYPLPNNITLKYGNINITKCLDVKLGNLFPNKKQIKLNIISNSKQSPNTLRPIKKLMKNNSTITNKNNETKPYIYKYTKLKLPPISKNVLHNLSMNNIKLNILYNNDNKIKNNNLIAPKIKLKSVSGNRDIKKKLVSEKKFDWKNLNFKTINNDCEECVYMDINCYCRDCNKFICIKCFEKIHSIKNHLNIDVDNNNYKTFSKYNEKLYDKFNKSLEYLNYLENYKDDKINIDIWDKKYKEDIDKLVEVTHFIQNNLKNEENNNDNNMNNELDLDYIQKEYIYINGIDCKMSSEPLEIFYELNNREKEIYKIINAFNNNIYMKKTISEKINGFFNDVEDEIDKIIFELDQKVYETKKNNYRINK